MGKVNIELYINNYSKNSAKGKTYGRVLHPKGTMNTRALAKHIAEHGSIYTLDVIQGVLAALEKCIPEQLLQGKVVKLDGLGTFGLYASTIGEEKTEDFTLEKNLKSLAVRFMPERSDWADWKSSATSTAAKANVAFSNYVVVEGSIAADGSKQDRVIRYLRGKDVPEGIDPETGGSSGGGGGDEEEDRP